MRDKSTDRRISRAARWVYPVEHSHVVLFHFRCRPCDCVDTLAHRATLVYTGSRPQIDRRANAQNSFGTDQLDRTPFGEEGRVVKVSGERMSLVRGSGSTAVWSSANDTGV